MSYWCPLYRPLQARLPRESACFPKEMSRFARAELARTLHCRIWNFLTIHLLEDAMRKQFFIPHLAGMLMLGAAQAFAQSATVVMRNGDRVRADVIDMGRNFTLNVNGETRQVPIGDIVLIDFAGDGR